jgi:hypothetical protein
MLLTSAEYETITGETAPIAFDAILGNGAGRVRCDDAQLLQRHHLTMPALIQSALKRYLAYQC